jgi:NO-binding membrane sensor protein with MHYT domain
MIRSIGLGWLITFVVNILLVSLALWVVGRGIVGGDKARLSDAFWITLLGVIIGYAIMHFIPLVGLILVLILWVALIHHFFDTGWLGAVLVGIIAIVVYAALTWILTTLLKVPLTPFWKLS